MSNIVTINNWYVCSEGMNFCYPKEPSLHLYGVVSGHPRVIDGHRAHTTKIVDWDYYDRLVTTETGTKYRLGDASREWLEYLYDQGLMINDFWKQINLRRH